jgi:hypothetical protein
VCPIHAPWCPGTPVSTSSNYYQLVSTFGFTHSEYSRCVPWAQSCSFMRFTPFSRSPVNESLPTTLNPKPSGPPAAVPVAARAARDAGLELNTGCEGLVHWTLQASACNFSKEKDSKITRKTRVYRAPARRATHLTKTSNYLLHLGTATQINARTPGRTGTPGRRCDPPRKMLDGRTIICHMPSSELPASLPRPPALTRCGSCSTRAPPPFNGGTRNTAQCSNPCDGAHFRGPALHSTKLRALPPDQPHQPRLHCRCLCRHQLSTSADRM